MSKFTGNDATKVANTLRNQNGVLTLDPKKDLNGVSLNAIMFAVFQKQSSDVQPRIKEMSDAIKTQLFGAPGDVLLVYRENLRNFLRMTEEGKKKVNLIYDTFSETGARTHITSSQFDEEVTYEGANIKTAAESYSISFSCFYRYEKRRWIKSVPSIYKDTPIKEGEWIDKLLYYVRITFEYEYPSEKFNLSHYNRYTSFLMGDPYFIDFKEGRNKYAITINEEDELFYNDNIRNETSNVDTKNLAGINGKFYESLDHDTKNYVEYTSYSERSKLVLAGVDKDEINKLMRTNKVKSGLSENSENDTIYNVVKPIFWQDVAPNPTNLPKLERPIQHFDKKPSEKDEKSDRPMQKDAEEHEVSDSVSDIPPRPRRQPFGQASERVLTREEQRPVSKLSIVRNNSSSRKNQPSESTAAHEKNISGSNFDQNRTMVLQSINEKKDEQRETNESDKTKTIEEEEKSDEHQNAEEHVERIEDASKIEDEIRNLEMDNMQSIQDCVVVYNKSRPYQPRHPELFAYLETVKKILKEYTNLDDDKKLELFVAAYKYKAFQSKLYPQYEGFLKNPSKENLEQLNLRNGYFDKVLLFTGIRDTKKKYANAAFDLIKNYVKN